MGRQASTTEMSIKLRGNTYSMKMVPRGLEPRTLRLLAVRSNQLSYETNVVGLQEVFENLQTKSWPRKNHQAIFWAHDFVLNASSNDWPNIFPDNRKNAKGDKNENLRSLQHSSMKKLFGHGAFKNICMIDVFNHLLTKCFFQRPYRIFRCTAGMHTDLTIYFTIFCSLLKHLHKYC